MVLKKEVTLQIKDFFEGKSARPEYHGYCPGS
jgi:hypothetical protein